MKEFLKFTGLVALGYAAFASIILADCLIAPGVGMVVLGIEFIAFIKSMDYMHKTNKHWRKQSYSLKK